MRVDGRTWFAGTQFPSSDGLIIGSGDNEPAVLTDEGDARKVSIFLHTPQHYRDALTCIGAPTDELATALGENFSAVRAVDPASKHAILGAQGLTDRVASAGRPLPEGSKLAC